MATSHDELLPPSAAGTSPLRVLFLMDVLDDHQERFLQAYEQIRHQVADVPGHVSDQLCQSLGNSSQWLITSEWEDSESFLAWVDSQAHRELVAPLSACLGSRNSLRYVITRQTPDPLVSRPEPADRAAIHGQLGPAAGAPRTDPLPAPPLASGGIVRHGITFTVKPGSEPAVAEILANYSAPQARVDATTRLRRTSLFMYGNRVVRAVEVTGDLGNAMRHVAAQPEVRAVEEAINPYLEEPRDFSDPTSVRAFFARAALPAVHHAQAMPGPKGPVTRRGFLYTVRPGGGEAAVRLLADLDEAAVRDPGQPLTASTLFRRDDLVVRVVDWRGPGLDWNLTTADGPRDLLASGSMDLITDRGA
ncbi:MAG TPA: SchA/CurD-like domain-containing protein [Trebonia sp.]|nr:SchA/CurD-like domain-containing protein [Trebonia sp.]